MIADITEAVNLALSSLGEPPLTDVTTDTGTTAIECRRWIDIVRRRELMAFDWPFAIRRVDISPEVNPANIVDGWTSSYTLPSDVLRFFPITDSGEIYGNPIDHQIENGFILVDQSSDLRIRYIADVDTPAQWSANFVEVFIASFAVTLAENITGLSQALSTASARYEQALARGHRYEMRQQGTPADSYSSAWLSERV